MNIVFTICSNNYLAQAKVLGDSLFRHNPEYKFIIGLVDRFSDEVDYDFFKPYEIIPIDELGIEGFSEMVDRYNITELNTAVKPYIFNFIFKRENAVENIFYFDPDIYIYQKIDYLSACLKEHNIVLTPHFMTPINDKYGLSEADILNAGLYNLGFIGVRRSGETQRFLDWWMLKLKDQCIIDFAKGLFVDQLWINLVPLYFEKVFIIRNFGYNVAYWNLHERKITKGEAGYTVNNEVPLVFYHFSGYNFNDPKNISKYQNRFTFKQRPDIYPLFQEYAAEVLSNKFNQLSAIPCYYITIGGKSRNTNAKALSYRDYFYLVRQKIKKDISGR